MCHYGDGEAQDGKLQSISNWINSATVDHHFLSSWKVWIYLECLQLFLKCMCKGWNFFHLVLSIVGSISSFLSDAWRICLWSRRTILCHLHIIHSDFGCLRRKVWINTGLVGKMGKQLSPREMQVTFLFPLYGWENHNYQLKFSNLYVLRSLSTRWRKLLSQIWIKINQKKCYKALWYCLIERN